MISASGKLDVTRLSESQLDESAHAAMQGERPEVLSAGRSLGGLYARPEIGYPDLRAAADPAEAREWRPSLRTG